MWYSAYGHALESDIPLRDLPPTQGPADLRIRATAERVNAADITPVPGLGGDQAPWLCLGRLADAFVLTFGGGGTFTLSPGADTVTVHLEADGLTATLQHLLVDQVLPLALGHRGRLVVHGSGLLIDGHGVAFIGPGGVGKSTLAAAFARRGDLVIADDALVMAPAVDRVVVHPAYPGIRVWPDVLETLREPDTVPFVDGYSEKRRLGVNQGLTFASACASLERIYVVRPDASSAPAIRPLTNREAVIALLTHTFVLDPTDAPRLTVQLDEACRVVEHIELRTLSFPRQLDRLDEVRREIQCDLASEPRAVDAPRRPPPARRAPR